MRHRRNKGFTLIELMVVITIIGICAAIVVPQLISHKRSSDLSDLVNMVQQTASQARSFALQTRRAAVLEVSGVDDKIWVNTLSGPRCWDSIAQTCVQTTGHKGGGNDEFDLSVEPYTSAGTALCGVSVSVVTGAGTDSAACIALTEVTASSDFAICYAGDGELYVRPEADTGTICSGGAASAGMSAWLRACPTVETGPTSSGAVLMFNRFESGDGVCSGDGGTSDIMDVTRAVYLPIGGAPYSRVQL